MIDRESALAIIQKFNGFILPGSSVPLQVRFADSMAQKKLKSQTQRKRVWRAQESVCLLNLQVILVLIENVTALFSYR